MNKILLIALFTFSNWGCFAQPKKTLVPETVIYNFISKSQLLENLSPKNISKQAKVYLDNTIKRMTQRFKSECGIFTNIKNLLANPHKDSAFIDAQLNDTTEFLWKKEFLSEWEIIDDNWDDISINKGVYLISRPLFSLNYELVIVNIIFIQGNYAKGSYQVYKKEGEKYMLINEFCKWRS